MHPTLAADTAVDAGGVSAVLEVVRDALTMTTVRPLRISAKGALGVDGATTVGYRKGTGEQKEDALCRKPKAN